MNTVVFIPARGGSKGVINKNLRLVNEKPLITYTLKVAILSQTSKVILSSDSEKIHEIAREFVNLECKEHKQKLVHHFRPSELSTDTSLISDVICDYFRNNLIDSNGILVLLQPTSPIRRTIDINNVIARFSDSSINSIVSACLVSQHPKEMFYQDKKLNFLLLGDSKEQQRQMYNKVYFINGSIYAARLNFYLKKKKFFDANSSIYFMDTISSVDIDTEDDLFI